MKVQKGSWKNMGHGSRHAEMVLGAKFSLWMTSTALAGLAAMILMNAAKAALPKQIKLSGCESKVSSLLLTGSFVMPGSGEPLRLWVGKRSAADKQVVGYVGKSSQEGCEAQCRVIRFERFKKDFQPALLELQCEGERLRTMRMPLHVQWVREQNGFDAVVRLGSSVYGTEEAPFHVELNRYAVASAK